MLAANLIGLDFTRPVGDLRKTNKASLGTQKYYWAFYSEMAPNDLVLILVRKFPTTLVRVVGQYDHIDNPEDELFRHRREVADVRYYGDFQKNPHEWSF